MASSKQTVRLEWDVSSLAKVRGKLATSERELKLALGAGFLGLIRSHIRSRTGQLAASWKVYPRGDSLVFSSNTPYSYASVKGNFIRPKGARALAFDVGGQRAFAKVVRYSPGAYMGRPRGVGTSRSYLDVATEEFPPVAEAAFKVAYGRL